MRSVDERLCLIAGRRLPRPQLMKLLGMQTSHQLRNWLANLCRIPWVTVERGKDDVLVSVNEELRAIIDFHRSQPALNGISYIAFLADMQREITRRRKENHDDRMKYVLRENHPEVDHETRSLAETFRSWSMQKKYKSSHYRSRAHTAWKHYLKEARAAA